MNSGGVPRTARCGEAVKGANFMTWVTAIIILISLIFMVAAIALSSSPDKTLSVTDPGTGQTSEMNTHSEKRYQLIKILSYIGTGLTALAFISGLVTGATSGRAKQVCPTNM